MSTDKAVYRKEGYQAGILYCAIVILVSYGVRACYDFDQQLSIDTACLKTCNKDSHGDRCGYYICTNEGWTK